MTTSSLKIKSGPFLDFLDKWVSELPILRLPEPERSALLAVDLVAGFCDAGPLAGPRARALAAPAAAWMRAAWQRGLTTQLLLQDTHSPDALEFFAWPPHCVRGTAEAESVAELKALPFYDRLLLIEKNTLSSDMQTSLGGWLDTHREVDTFIVIGDCTDLCVYQLAMFLRLDANARRLQRRVIVPAELVDTYDYPVETAQASGGLPHPGDLMHALALYQMALNGVEVVKKVE